MKSENWKTVRLGDVCILEKGKQIDTSLLDDSNPYRYINGGIKESGFFSDFNTEGESVLISEGGASCGYINYVNEKFWCGCHCYRLHDIKVFPKYLFHALKANQRRIMALRTGCAMPNIQKTTIQNFELNIHEKLETQKHIAAVLDKCTAVIAKHKQMLVKYDTLIKSRFIEMFGDIIQNTKNWELKIFTEIAKSRLGKMLDSKKQTGKEKYPYLANFNVQWFRFNLENLNEMDFSEADRIEFALKDGDLLVCEGGEVGRCAVWHNQIENCFFQKAVHRVRLNMDFVHPDYMAYWFKFRSDFNSFDDIVGSKATIAHLTGEKLKLLQIPVPPLALQNDFATFVQQIDKSKFAVQNSLHKTEILYKSLMQTYFG